MANVTKRILATEVLEHLSVVGAGQTASAEDYTKALRLVTSVFGVLTGKNLLIPVTAGGTVDEDQFDEKFLLALRDVSAFHGAKTFGNAMDFSGEYELGLREIRRMLTVSLERTDDAPAVEAEYY